MLNSMLGSQAATTPHRVSRGLTLCLLPSELRVRPLCVSLMWLSLEPTFIPGLSWPFKSPSPPPISVSFHGFQFPYLLCLPLTRLQHPPPHSCCRAQLLLLSPKKSMSLKHIVSFLPSLLPSVESTDTLYDRMIGRRESGAQRERICKDTCFNHPLAATPRPSSPSLKSPSKPHPVPAPTSTGQFRSHLDVWETWFLLQVFIKLLS